MAQVKRFVFVFPLIVLVICNSNVGVGRVSGSGQTTTSKPIKAGITFDQFKAALTLNGYPAPSLGQYNNFMTYGKGKISSKQETAMFLAQVIHESSGLKEMIEPACKNDRCYGQYVTKSCDARRKRYYGRGYIQLKWCHSYREASRSMFKNDLLVHEPELVAKYDDIAWQTAFWYWEAYVHKKAGVRQGYFGATTKAFNLGADCKVRGNQQAERRFKIYGNVRKAFGLPGAGNPAGCA